MQPSLSLDDTTEGIHLIVRPILQSGNIIPLIFNRLNLSEAAARARDCQDSVETGQQELAFICRQADGPEESLVFLTLSVRCQAINAERQREGREDETSQEGHAGATDGEGALPDLALRSEREREAADGLLLLRRCTSRDFERVAYPVFDAQEPGSPTSSSDSLYSNEDPESGDAFFRFTSRSASPATTAVSRPPTRASDNDICARDGVGNTELPAATSHDDPDTVTEPQDGVQIGLANADQTHLRRNAAPTAPESVPSTHETSEIQPIATPTVAPPSSPRSQRVRASSQTVRTQDKDTESTPPASRPASPSTQAGSNTPAPEPQHAPPNDQNQEEAPRPSAPSGRLRRCTYCDRPFKANKDRLRHENSAHTKILRWRCDVCSRILSRGDSVQRHLRDRHGIREPRYTVIERLDTKDGAVGKEKRGNKK